MDRWMEMPSEGARHFVFRVLVSGLLYKGIWKSFVKERQEF